MPTTLKANNSIARRLAKQQAEHRFVLVVEDFKAQETRRVLKKRIDAITTHTVRTLVKKYQ